MSPSKLADLVTCFGKVFVQLYASTEVPMMVTVLDKSEHTDDEIGRRRLSSAGRAMPGVEIIVTAPDGAVMRAGEIGDIRLRSRAVIAGYHNDSVATSREFENGFWLSGDVGYLDEDGFLYIVDRSKDMIVSGGFNVYAIEAESALMSHPAVLMAAVVGIPHEDWGESVHAEVVLRPGLTTTSAELIAHAKLQIAAYKAPKSIAFVDELPVSVVGKVLRRKVREPYWTGQSRNVG
jgi:acyl-CoA synthetase (AMP-forming)/AMP-acid ligase II